MSNFHFSTFTSIYNFEENILKCHSDDIIPLFKNLSMAFQGLQHKNSLAWHSKTFLFQTLADQPRLTLHSCPLMHTPLPNS